MEKSITEGIRQKLGTEQFKDPYADEVLTEEEVEAALRKARYNKAIARNEREYLEKISKPKEYPKPTIDQFSGFILNKIKVDIPDYVLDDDNKHNFHLLCLYFMGDPEFETIDGGRYRLNKGIALLGPIGCGKTSMIYAFNINPTNPFVPVSCRTVAGDYSLKDGGNIAIQKYSSVAEVPAYEFFGHKYVGRLFDDLGTENAKKHFGNESNVMEEIILNRYENADLKGKTHITSNLSAEQIEELYGPRVRSRLRQMCNFIVFNSKGGDRRK